MHRLLMENEVLDRGGEWVLNVIAHFCNSVQNNSATKLSSNVVLEQRLKMLSVKILIHFGFTH